MTYNPPPIPSNNVELPKSLRDLTEQLAEHTHDLWAAHRIAEGWTLGPVRDESKKEHPCLVPYGQLPETEKEYDRKVALGTLEAIYRFGFKINLPDEIDASSHASLRLLLNVFAKRGMEVSSLPHVWQRENAKIPDPEPTPEDYLRLGETLLKRGDPILAFDVLKTGLDRSAPDDPRLRQLQALALARSGVVDRANEILQKLVLEDVTDVETLGLLARTHKDLALESRKHYRSEAEVHLQFAHRYYEKAYRQSGEIWPGINLATVAVLRGELDWARDVAKEIRERCHAKLENVEFIDDPYWPRATLGEASLILGELSEAEDWYVKASKIAEQQQRFGDLSSTRRQARLLLEELGGDPTRLDHCLRIPCVALITGHMIDQPGRPVPRFPMALEEPVKIAIKDRLLKSGARFGYAAGACGADLLFLEAILELGGESHVVLPYDCDQYRADCVDIIEEGHWGERFDQVLARSEVTIASRHRLERGSISFEFATHYLHGLATIDANQLQTKLVRLAVWDGKPGDGPGGTADIVAGWQAKQFSVEIINPATLSPSGTQQFSERFSTSHRIPNVLETRKSGGSKVAAILFADVVKFSKLTESQLPLFVEHFLGLVADQIRKLPNPPIKKNTWGDGLFLVLESVREAGLFALDLCDRVREKNWEEIGLPNTLSFRVALHAGPILFVVDPVTELANCIGTHVSHAARIEPITPPGQVYASEAFAALVATEPITQFTCEYVGKTALDKKHGTFPTYHVKRTQ